MEETKKFVVVTTDKDKRGVFGGYLEVDNSEEYVILTQAQMAVYWPEVLHGVLGLASIGPQEGARISYPVPEIKLFGITAIMNCTDKAVQQWQKALWSNK